MWTNRRYWITSDAAPVAYIGTDEEAPIRYGSDIKFKPWAGDIDLNKIDQISLGSMVKSFYHFNDFDFLVIWYHYFIGKTMNEVSDVFDISITQQRAIYNKYKRIAEEYRKNYNKEIGCIK